jgi:hypothetical protein
VFLAKDGDEMLSTAVDARTGVLLFRSNQIDHAEGDEGRVFRNYPGAPHGGQHELVSFEGDPEASPEGWVGAAPTTAGNNVVAFTDLLWPKLAPGGRVLALSQLNPVPDSMPVAPARSFDFAWDNSWGGACEPEVLPDGSEVENPSYLDDRDPSVTNIFYFGNAIHDFAYKLGFNEEMGNFQLDNFDNGGKGLDPVRFMSMSGILNGNIDNAFMFTPADGGEPTALIDDENPANTPAKILNHYPPFSGMFLFRPVPGFEARCSDSSQDASIAYHEYTHGITNRVTGGPDDADALNAPQSGAMGEAWSDWFALHILHTLGLEDRAVAGG